MTERFSIKPVSQMSPAEVVQAMVCIFSDTPENRALEDKIRQMAPDQMAMIYFEADLFRKFDQLVEEGRESIEKLMDQIDDGESIRCFLDPDCKEAID